MDSKKWYASKTVWISIFGVVYALAGYVSGNMSLNESFIALQVALGAWGIRLGIN